MTEQPADSARGLDSPHRHRDIAQSFGVDAERYDRVRPRYPQALVDSVLAALSAQRKTAGEQGARLLDGGIGTGISARPFRDAGCTVLGVEPDPGMAQAARRRGFTVEEGTFEAWDPAGRTFDAVISGQAWQWIDPVRGAQQAARALNAGGLLVPFWNVGDPPPELASAFAAVYRDVDTGLPFTPFAASAVDGYGRILERVEDGIRESGGFGDTERWRFDWQATITRAEWLEQVPTAGGHSGLPATVLSALLDGMGAAIDSVGGAFTMNYATVAVVARSTGASLAGQV